MTMKSDWASRNRMSKLASILYPDLADDDAKRDMNQLAKNEGKVSPMEARKRFLEKDRGGKAKK